MTSTYITVNHLDYITIKLLCIANSHPLITSTLLTSPHLAHHWFFYPCIKYKHYFIDLKVSYITHSLICKLITVLFESFQILIHRQGDLYVQRLISQLRPLHICWSTWFPCLSMCLYRGHNIPSYPV